MIKLPARTPSPELLLAPVLLVGLALCLGNLCPSVMGTYHDDGIYVVTAKALATGQGYRIISLPNLLPQTKYPFFYPYLLSLIWRVYPHFPGNVLPMKLLSVVTSLLFLLFSYRLMTRFRYASPMIALGAVAMAAWCAWTVFYSSMVLSEMPYAFFSVLALYVAEAAMSKPTGYARSFYIMAAALLSGIVCLTRSIGLMLAISILFYLLYNREWRRAVFFTAIVSAMVLPWVLWVRIQALPPGLDAMELYYVDYTHWISYYAGGYFSIPMLNVLCKNLIYCLSGIVTLSNPIFAFAPLPLGFTIHAGIEAVLVLAGLGLGGLGVCAALRYFRFRPRILHIYMGLYMASVVLWPWPPLRFLVPVAPFLILYNMRVIVWLTDSLVPRLPGLRIRRVAHVLVVGFAAGGLPLNLALSVAVVRETLTYGFPLPPNATSLGGSWGTASGGAMQWIARNTPPDATLSAVFDPMYYLYTGRRAVRGFAINPVESFYSAEPSKFSISRREEVIDFWRRSNVSYVVLIPDAEPLLSTYIKDLIQTHPRLLSLAYMTPTESVIVFKLNRAALPPPTHP